MPTAILDLDLEQLPAGVTGLEGYSQALVLIRLRGQPVGQARFTVNGGRIDGAELRDTLIRAAGWPLWGKWLHDYLEFEPTPPTSSGSPTATVAVCTRDRPEDLRRCLEGILRLPDDGQELLVIDNCPSTDATRKVVAATDGRVRYVREDRPGLDIARNRALREARHEVVAFVDDDAVPDPGWLRALLRNFDDPLVLCVTGLTMPLELETRAQEYFECFSPFGRGFKRVVWDSTKLSPLASGRVGVGVNMALRHTVVEQVGPFDEALDVGTLTRSGGDNEMFSRILAAGYRIVYDPSALSWHRHRRAWSELRRTFYGYGVGVYAAWTRSLLVEWELSAPRTAWRWLRHNQLITATRTFRRRGKGLPLDLALAQLAGCIMGPCAYLSSRKRLRISRNKQ